MGLTLGGHDDNPHRIRIGDAAPGQLLFKKLEGTAYFGVTCYRCGGGYLGETEAKGNWKDKKTFRKFLRQKPEKASDKKHAGTWSCDCVGGWHHNDCPHKNQWYEEWQKSQGGENG